MIGEQAVRLEIVELGVPSVDDVVAPVEVPHPVFVFLRVYYPEDRHEKGERKNS